MYTKKAFAYSFMFLISITIIFQVSAQTYVVGVEQGDSFTYETSVYWFSTNLNATVPQSAIEQNQTRIIRVTVKNVSGTNLTAEATYFYANGTTQVSNLTANVLSGAQGQPFFIASNLGVNDAIGSDPYSKQIRINETIQWNYITGSRETNHLKYVGTINYDYYFDKSTGVLVEYDYQYDQYPTEQSNNQYVTTLVGKWKITTSSIWVATITSTPTPNISPSPSIPEYPSLIVVPILMATILASILFYKKRIRTL